VCCRSSKGTSSSSSSKERSSGSSSSSHHKSSSSSSHKSSSSSSSRHHSTSSSSHHRSSSSSSSSRIPQYPLDHPFSTPGGVRLTELTDELIRKLPFRSQLHGLKYKRFMKVEQHPNGGAWLLRAYHHEFQHLSRPEQTQFAYEFFKVHSLRF